MKGLTDIKADFSGWYNELVQKAELADHAPVRGCMVIRPYGYALWERMQQFMDARIKATGHQNAYFPLFLPTDLLAKEAGHIEGFNAEGVRVTKIGGKELDKDGELVVRFSSEAIIMEMFSKWVQSHRDLPLMVNQWCNVVRWELRPRLFLRTSEFLWQEGHTAHATEAEARTETMTMLHVYRDFMEQHLAISPYTGRKTEKEKFAGAEETYTCEGLMGDGKALQMGTSHFFGQRFARAFGIKFQSTGGTQEFAWTTSWGSSTRMIGAVIMAHGDAKGLVLPPEIAPYQVVIVPILKSDSDSSQVLAEAHAIKAALSSLRVYVDDRDQYKPGHKFNEWELKGVPLRIELGARDLAARQVVIADRRTGEKTTIARDALPETLPRLLREFQQALLDANRKLRDTSTRAAATLDELTALVEGPGGFVRVPWCGMTRCEDRIKEACKATARCIVPDAQPEGPCLFCSMKADKVVLFARAY